MTDKTRWDIQDQTRPLPSSQIACDIATLLDKVEMLLDECLYRSNVLDQTSYVDVAVMRQTEMQIQKLGRAKQSPRYKQRYAENTEKWRIGWNAGMVDSKAAASKL